MAKFNNLINLVLNGLPNISTTIIAAAAAALLNKWTSSCAVLTFSAGCIIHPFYSDFHLQQFIKWTRHSELHSAAHYSPFHLFLCACLFDKNNNTQSHLWPYASRSINTTCVFLFRLCRWSIRDATYFTTSFFPRDSRWIYSFVFLMKNWKRRIIQPLLSCRSIYSR